MSTPVVFAGVPAGGGGVNKAAAAATALQPQPRQGAVTTHQGLALLTALNGSATALRVRLTSSSVTRSSSTTSGYTAEAVWLEPLWTVRGPAPVFSAPLLLPMWGPMPASAVPAEVRQSSAAAEVAATSGASGSAGGGPGVLAVVPHVDGCVRAVWADPAYAGTAEPSAEPMPAPNSAEAAGGGTASPGSAVVSWSLQLRGNLFADLLLLPLPEAETAAAATTDALLPTGTTATASGRAVPGERWRRGLLAQHDRQHHVALAATHAGLLYGLDLARGHALWCLDLGCGPISAAPAAITVAVAAAAAAGDTAAPSTSAGVPAVRVQGCGSVVAVLASSGSVALVALGSQGGEVATCVQGYRMPAETFSSPAVVCHPLRRAGGLNGGSRASTLPAAAHSFLLFGCRDDCVYSLALN